ncbi:MAG: SpoIID/LytB domain-containing protein [Armatimonadota bacterium]
MIASRTIAHTWFLTLYLFALALLSLAGAYGQDVPKEVRIGLQTGQSEVRLQGTVPIRVESGGTEILSLTADQILVAKPVNGGITLFDTAGATLYACAGKVRVSTIPINPEQMQTPETAADTVPLIRLLGPTRHYDKKPDRPYRGFIELLPAKDGITVVNQVSLEEYLWGVVPSEMGYTFPLEALKAQAVAARTYVIKHLGQYAARGYNIDDTPACQVYGGYLIEKPSTTKAVNETAGMVLRYNRKPIDAMYSSTCGGITESAACSLGRHIPYLVSVPDGRNADGTLLTPPNDEEGWASYFKTASKYNCLQSSFARVEAFRWVKLITRAELEAGLPEQFRVGTVQDIQLLKRGDSGRLISVRLKGSDREVTIEKEGVIRKAFGGLRSSAFTVDTYRDDDDKPVVFAFWGAGWGHGLGMCQVGAVGLALQGWDFQKILKYYYRDVTVGR